MNPNSLVLNVQPGKFRGPGFKGHDQWNHLMAEGALASRVLDSQGRLVKPTYQTKYFRIFPTNLESTISLTSYSVSSSIITRGGGGCNRPERGSEAVSSSRKMWKTRCTFIEAGSSSLYM